MTEAKRAARASALAFAVGLGVAVATGHGVAAAETSDSDGSSSSGNPSASDSTSPASKSSGTGSSDPSGTTGSAGDASSTGASKSEPQGSAGGSATEPDDDSADPTAGESADDEDSPTTGDADSESGESADAEETDEESGTEEPTDEESGTEEPTDEESGTEEPTDEESGTEEPTDEEPATEEPTVEEPATEEPTPQAPAEQDPTTAPASGSGRDSGATGQVEQPSDESAITSSTDAVAETTQATGLSDVDVDAADEQATQQVSVTDLTAAPTAATETATDTATQTTATLEQAAAAPVSPVQTAVLALADFVVGVATALLSPFVATGPNGPTGPAASLLELIYVARSRFQDTFFNSSPIVEPMQIAQTGEVVTGTLNAYDADFDRLVYTVTQAPQHGTVVINDDGTFTYTPDAVLADAGGVDTFEITATEADEFHLHGLRGVLTLGGLLDGLFGLPSAHSASSMVAVAVSPIDGTGTIIVGENPQGVALSADGTRAYVTNSGSNSVSVIDVATNTVIHTIEDVGNYPAGVVSGSGKVYVSNLFDNTVSVIDTTTNTVTATVGVGDTPQGIALSADGTRLYVANTDGDTVSVIDTATNTVTATIDAGAAPQHVAVNADGTRVYVTNYDDGTLSVIDTATNTVVDTITVGDTPQAVAVSPDGTRLYVTGYDRGTVSVVDVATNEVVAVTPVGLYPDAIAVSADGTRAYVTNEANGSVTVIDTATNAVVGAIPLGDTGSAIAVSADGTRLYVPNFDAGTLTVTAVNLGATPPARGLGVSDLRNGGYNTFWVHNFSGETVQFLGYQYQSNLYAGPENFTEIAPGESAGFTFRPSGYGNPIFASGVFGEPGYRYYVAHFDNDPGQAFPGCRASGAQCGNFSRWDVALIPSSADVTVTDPAVQSAILNALCRDTSLCSFAVTRQEETSGPSHGVGATVTNNTDKPDTSTAIKVTDIQSQTSSVSISTTVGVNIKSIVNASISATYGHSWTYTHKFSQTVQINNIPPYTTASVTATQPIFRVYGDFTVDFYGLTTFHLRNAVFDTPNPNGQSNYETNYTPCKTKPCSDPVAP